MLLIDWILLILDIKISSITQKWRACACHKLRFGVFYTVFSNKYAGIVRHRRNLINDSFCWMIFQFCSFARAKTLFTIYRSHSVFIYVCMCVLCHNSKSWTIELLRINLNLSNCFRKRDMKSVAYTLRKKYSKMLAPLILLNFNLESCYYSNNKNLLCVLKFENKLFVYSEKIKSYPNTK